MPAPFRLYGRPNAGSWVIQVALEEAGAPYELEWIGSEAADVQKYSAVNPTGKIPGLVLPDGTSMFESAAMLIYLASAFPKSGLAPEQGVGAYASFLQWMVFLSANVYESALRVYYSNRYTAAGESGAEVVRTQAAEAYFGHLSLIAGRLNPYVLGERYSIADAYLYMLTNWWVGDKDELFGRLPALKAHGALMAARPAVVKVDQVNAAVA